LSSPRPFVSPETTAAGWAFKVSGPDHYAAEACGCTLGLRFRPAKLLDFRAEAEALERNPNPFAAVVLAQLKELETRQAPAERGRWKVRLIKGL
jgi:hypothetical protein